MMYAFIDGLMYINISENVLWSTLLETKKIIMYVYNNDENFFLPFLYCFLFFLAVLSWAQQFCCAVLWSSMIFGNRDIAFFYSTYIHSTEQIRNRDSSFSIPKNAGQHSVEWTRNPAITNLFSFFNAALDFQCFVSLFRSSTQVGTKSIANQEISVFHHTIFSSWNLCFFTFI